MVAAQPRSLEGIDTLETRNPATGEPIGVVPVAGPDQVDAAVARGERAAETWGALSFAERREQLVAWRRELARRAEEVADLIHRENGKPRLDAIAEVFIALSHLAHAADRAEKALRPRSVSPGVLMNFRARITHHPLGVIGVIGPWNFPLFTPMGSIAYALAAGNAVVFKPSELTPLVGRMFEETCAAAVRVPDLLQVVTGDGRTGTALARSRVAKLAFTGSTATGRKVLQAAAERLTPVLLELGGKDAMIVTEDADVARAAEAAVYGALFNAGQACTSIERVYAVDAIYDRFVDLVVAEARQVVPGPGEDAHLGAMTRPQQIDAIRDQLKDALDKGARALVGGLDSIRGAFIAPTVLVDVTHDMKVMREETFGPVLPIVRARDADEAVRMANATSFGLGSSVFGGATARRVADRIRAGATAINSVTAFAAIPSLPFGGIGDSGFGRIHGDEGLREFTRIKGTAEERFPLPLNLLSFKLPKRTYGDMVAMIRQLFGGGVVDQVGAALRSLRR
jgi:acyl-CoA reductase-like NAD-dependent aldehyde dehydrogenase